jgi:uncharacterized protein with PIN domain
MSYANPRQEPKDYDLIIIPSRIKDDFRWRYCGNCGHRLVGVYADKVVEADTGVYRNVDTSYTVYYQCDDCKSVIRIVLATEVG